MKLSQTLKPVRRKELAWIYSNFSYICTLRLVKLLLPYHFHDRLGKDQFMHILNFLKNQRGVLLKANEVVEIFLFNEELYNSLNLTQIFISPRKHLSDCGKTCGFKFSIWNSKQRALHNLATHVISENCEWSIFDEDSKLNIPIDSVDMEQNKIFISPSNLKSSFFLNISLKCKSRQMQILHIDDLSSFFENSFSVKISRDLQLGYVKADIVKGKSIPNLNNKHFSCRTLELKASQYNILYAIVAFDGLHKPDPLRDSVFLQLSALHVFDNFQSPKDKGLDYFFPVISSENREHAVSDFQI